MKIRTKIAAIVAAAVAASLLLTGCQLSTIFGGETTSENADGSVTTTPVTVAVPEPMDLSGIDFSQYIKLNYKDIPFTVTSLPISPGEEEIDSELSSILVSYGLYDLDTTAEKTALGDYLEIEYTGYMEGETFEGGTSEKSTILLDTEKSGYIPGFADGLIGVKPGAEVELNLTFPENYYDDIAGKPVTFKVKIHGICRLQMTDESAATLSDGKYTTLNEYRVYLKDYLTEISGHNAFSEVYDQLWSEIMDRSEVISYPDKQYQYYYSLLTNDLISSALSAGMDYEAYLAKNGITAESIDEEIKSYIKSDLVIYGIAAAENVELTEEDYSDYVNKYYAYYAQYLIYYGYTTEQIVSYLRNQAFSEAVLFAAFSYCTLTENTGASDTPETTSAPNE